MKTYARIDAGAIAELLTTALDITTLFYPSLTWVDVTGLTVQVGWLQQGGGYVAPPSATNSLPAPSLADLQAQLASLSAQIAAFQPGA
jgi:hypothetical protein